tara:strand:+ start:484 stop:600 length:117 start_codon:yes stop_codon:yes gene_type:complete
LAREIFQVEVRWRISDSTKMIGMARAARKRTIGAETMC